MALTPSNSHGPGGTAASPDVVVGNVAAGVADSGAPVKVGGKYNSTKPTLTNGLRGDVQLTTRGAVLVTPVQSDSDIGATFLAPMSDTMNGGSGVFGAQLVAALGAAFNGSTFERLRTVTTFKNVNALLITAEQTVWTPTTGKKFRLMGFVLTQGVVTGAVTLKDNTGGTTILVIPPMTVGVALASPPMGNGILSAANNNVLTATGLATETITGFFFGTEE